MWKLAMVAEVLAVVDMAMHLLLLCPSLLGWHLPIVTHSFKKCLANTVMVRKVRAGGATETPHYPLQQTPWADSVCLLSKTASWHGCSRTQGLVFTWWRGQTYLQHSAQDASRVALSKGEVHVLHLPQQACCEVNMCIYWGCQLEWKKALNYLCEI